MTDISTVLVANRGEIAVRIQRCLREQGLRSVAVFSEADADAAHVRQADIAMPIGGHSASTSYLDQEKILQAARDSGADAIHPGYGFLSENATFARAVDTAGLVFIGPPATAIEIMGDKAVSKRAMLEAGVPCLPGYHGTDQSEQRLLSEAREIGFPLMVKAAAGGGGRGMRLVHREVELVDAIHLARSEAESAFGNGELILERALLKPRHVEIQVFADARGNVIHLGERDCSVQRRHQKVIEESPCPVMTPELREQMGEAAIQAARAVHYVGAGTVEFLLDEQGQFYFLEMNTRLQVEHPVTEQVTGLDLVALQLTVAQGHPLPLGQDDISLCGHAIEARLYAEDPTEGFLPCTGTALLWRPAAGEGVRVDSGIASGSRISAFYDPMVAKIIATGDNREQARRRLLQALDDTVLLGVGSNRDFLRAALDKPAFVRGEATTAFVEQTFGDGFEAPSLAPADWAAAAALQTLITHRLSLALSVPIPGELLGWSNTATLYSVCRLGCRDQECELTVHFSAHERLEAHHGDNRHSMEILQLDDQRATFRVDGRRWTGFFHAQADGTLDLVIQGRGQFKLRNLLNREQVERATGDGPEIRAPMHGLVLSIEVHTGSTVDPGERLLVMEAMKMQHVIRAEQAGSVAAVLAEVGQQVASGDVLLTIQPASA